MKKVFITFATKNTIYVHHWHKTIFDAGLRLKSQADDIGLFDKSILYTEEYLQSDKEFWNKHESFIKKNKKGYGYYIWKPYIIKKTMENMDDGEMLLYLDAGCEFNIKNRKHFNYFENEIKKEKIIGYITGLLEHNWTNKDLFLKLNMYEYKHAFSMQRQGGTNMFYVCDETRKLVNEWYELACDRFLMRDSIKSESTVPDLQPKMHNGSARHDQSIFSLLTKKYNIYACMLQKHSIMIWKRNRTGISQIKDNINTDKLEKKTIIKIH